MESEVDKVEVQTVDEIVAKFNRYNVLKLKEFIYRFICQLNMYKPAVSVFCFVESGLTFNMSKYT